MDKAEESIPPYAEALLQFTSGSNAYEPAYEPYAHQKVALERCKDKEAFAYLMEMRTGKTKVTIDDFGRLEYDGKVQNLFVIAPGGVYRTWEADFKKHASKDLMSRASLHIWRSGAGARERREREAFMKDPSPRVLLMNVEALSSVKEARVLAEQFLSLGPTYLALDEATMIQNASAKRTQFIIKVLASKAPYRRILTGLVTPTSPMNIYSQFYFLDWRILGHQSFYSFRARYAVLRRVNFGGRSVQIIEGFRDIDDISRKIEPHSYRVRLADCYDLPEKTYSIREVELTPEQRRLYDEMKKFSTAQLAVETHVTATVVIAQIMRLHQILCGHTTDENGQFHEIPENRTAQLIELLSEYEGKAIIWCSYDADIQKVSAKLKKEFGENSVALFWGGNQKTREQEESSFKNDSSCRFMVATAAAGGRGREWSVANLVVYYSSRNDLEHRSQSEERPQAIGKTQPVAYVDLIVPGTVEIKILQALRDKISMASAINGDSYREWLI